ncbi:hypothetical protein NDU88_009509 [Pleurodeles waltl]|uniref:HEPN domain-containing protein n=3 Tax=Pleurodeles waltl TaxID=8319 RepID=A0AAV7PW17_PLEWA|nr:hypothetical protein NDU88_009509 [Pleurodeles waltl]
MFRPYLFKVPPHLAAYSDLFLNIGVEAEPTVRHYARVLATIYEETKDKTSHHPNQHRTLLKATAKIFLLLKECMPIQDVEFLKPLYLPDSHERLYDSSTLVFINCNSSREISHLKGDFKFLIHLEGCSVFNDEYELEKLLKQLPEDIRPKMLSQVTTESLESMVLCNLGDSCELKEQLQGLLLSSSFQEGLTSLLRAQSKGEMSAEKATAECQAVFRNLEIVCCERMQTVLLKGSLPLQGTSLFKDVFIKKGPEGQSQVCLVHKEAMNVRETVNIMSSLAKEINGLMMNLLVPQSMLILLEMLTCESPEEISSVLKKHSILTSKTASQAAFSLPNPGEKISREWHDSLDMNILNCFKVGDYVGYMDPSGEEVYLYAIILEKLELRVCGDTEVEMFRIDLGAGCIVDVSTLDLYQFKKSHINKNNCSKLKMMMENPEEQKGKENKWYEKSERDIKKEIDEQLAVIWKLSLSERKRSIRRLYLTYHPDKNLGQEKLANEICKYLCQVISNLEVDKNCKSEGCSEKQYQGFSEFWSQWDKQAYQHRKYYEEFTRKSDHSYTFWGYHNRRQRRSRPEEASRWFRQADCDLRAASSDIGHSSPEWVCYKVHQAVKKALIAALYKKEGNFSKDCHVYYLATKVSTFSSTLREIAKKVSELEKNGVDDNKTQYPNYHPKPGIPNDCIPSNQEKVVLKMARDVLDRINEYLQQ